jgi:hypothetical protein
MVDDWAEGMKEEGKKGREKGKRKRKDAEGMDVDHCERVKCCPGQCEVQAMH